MIGGAGIEPAQFTAPEDRRRGFRGALASAGLECDPALEVDGGFTRLGAASARWRRCCPPSTRRPRSSRSPTRWPSGRCGRSARRAALPDDVSVVGFDDHEMAEMLDLTTVAQPVVEQGVLAVGHIMAELRAEAAPSDELVMTHVVIRGTTAPPAARTSRTRVPARRTPSP